MTIERDPMFTSTKTAMPYRDTDGNPTVGSSAPGTSADRAERERARTPERQATILGMLREAGTVGLTYAEIVKAKGWSGGGATGTLSIMHKEGLILALKTHGIPNNSRNGCGIYVLPEHLAGRIARSFRSNSTTTARIEIEKIQARPRLTPHERALMSTIRSGLNSDAILRVPASTMKALLDALDRLDR